MSIYYNGDVLSFQRDEFHSCSCVHLNVVRLSSVFVLSLVIVYDQFVFCVCCLQREAAFNISL